MSMAWDYWFTIHPEVKMRPGGPVTALVPRNEHIDLFSVDQDGAVWTAWWEPAANWQNWFIIHPEVKMQPGATVTALVPRNDHIDLFVTGTDGAVWSTFWESGGDWQNWFLIHPEIKMQPGAAVTALVPRNDHIDLFVTGTDGAVWSTFWEPGPGWQNWFLIHPEIKMQPGATITALVPRNDHIDLFVTGTDGAVWSTFWEPGPSWQNWFLIRPEVKMQPGATVTALVPRNDHIDLFVTGTDGAVWSLWWGEFTAMTIEAEVDPSSGTIPMTVKLHVGESTGHVTETVVSYTKNGAPIPGTGDNIAGGVAFDRLLGIDQPGSYQITVSRTGLVQPEVQSTISHNYLIHATAKPATPPPTPAATPPKIDVQPSGTITEASFHVTGSGFTPNMPAGNQGVQIRVVDANSPYTLPLEFAPSNAEGKIDYTVKGSVAGASVNAAGQAIIAFSATDGRPNPDGAGFLWSNTVRVTVATVRIPA
jgi:hypothetical protein